MPLAHTNISATIHSLIKLLFMQETLEDENTVEDEDTIPIELQQEIKGSPAVEKLRRALIKLLKSDQEMKPEENKNKTA